MTEAKIKTDKELQTVVTEGQYAQQLLGNVLLERILSEQEQDCIENMLRTKLRDEETRAEWLMSVKMIRELRKRIVSKVNDAKQAALNLEYRATKTPRKRSILKDTDNG